MTTDTPPADDQQRSDLRDAIEQAIRGEGDAALTSAEVSASAGIDVAAARRLWRALGFAGVGDDDTAFSAADRDALALVAVALDSGSLDLETIVRLTRALGNTMARLADWQVATLAEFVESRTGGGQGSRLHSALELSQTVAPAFEQLMLYAWRRHLAAAVARVESLGAADEALLTQSMTVGFADLVSFTALTNGLEDDELADLVEGFETRCTDIVTAGGGRAIKSLGDSVLFVVEEPIAAVDIALEIVEVIGPDDRLPDVRVGLATGSVLSRLGDVFGPPVNLAARLTTVARRNRVICDDATAAALGEGFQTRSLPARPLRGFGVVEPVTVRRRWAFDTD